MNLITNASEALEEKEGVISITAAHVRAGSNDCVRLEVADTGKGMTEEVRAKIFDPFFTTKFAGRGLGLAAVQGIVRSHGGIVSVVSAPGEGSRFEVLLPCSGRPERGADDFAPPSTARNGETFSGDVLVIEDEQPLRLAVCRMLRRLGVTVIEASNGREGIDRLQAASRPVDVVLLDLTLPGMTGRVVLSELRRIQPGVSVVITTAYSQDWALAAVGEQRPWQYIRKPYHLSEVESLLREICRHCEETASRSF